MKKDILIPLTILFFTSTVYSQKQKTIDRFGDFIIGKTTINVIDTLKGQYPFYNSAYTYGDLEMEYNFRTKKNMKYEKALIQYGNEDTLANQFCIIDAEYALRTDYDKFARYTKIKFYHLKNYTLASGITTKDLILIFRQDTLRQIFFKGLESKENSLSEILAIRYGKPKVNIVKKKSCYDLEYHSFNTDDFEFYYWDVGYKIKMYFLDVTKYDGKCELLNYNNGYVYTAAFKNYFDKLIKLIDTYHDKIEELDKIKKYKDF